MGDQQTTRAERLRRIRREHNLTQRRLAVKLGVASSTIANWETGVIPISEQSVKRISTYFGVSLEWLRHGTGSPSDAPSEPTVEWPAEPLKGTWGVNVAANPAEWPIGFQEYISLAVQFGLDPQESTFRSMVKKAKELGSQSPLPLALSQPDSSRKRQLIEWVLLATETELDSVTEIIRKKN